MTRLHVPIALRWGDLDAFEHVNNATVLVLLEEARIRSFWEPAQGEDAPPTAVIRAGVGTGVLLLIARQEIEYIAPIPYQRAPIDVQLWFGRMGGSSLDIWYELYSPRQTAAEEGQTLYARAMTVMVKVDEQTGKPTRLSPEERAAWEPFVDEPLTFARRR